MLGNNLSIKAKVFIIISFSFILISTGVQLTSAFEPLEKYEISYEYVNIKDMAQAKISTKKKSRNSTNGILSGPNDLSTLTPVKLYSNNKNNKGTLEEVSLPLKENTESTLEVPKKIWYLPTEMGKITQNPRYGHVALDITSPRGSGEYIFPVANGVVSGIYKDRAGAKIVTVLHNINGKKYTSQYVHLSAYSKSIYVGKAVTINDTLGRMGTTGKSTGVHLHLALVDCALFDPNDKYCHDLGSFFRYANSRLRQGYTGLGAMIYVPGEWYSR